MKWILLQKRSRFVPFFFTPFLELNLLLENNSEGNVSCRFFFKLGDKIFFHQLLLLLSIFFFFFRFYIS